MYFHLVKHFDHDQVTDILNKVTPLLNSSKDLNLPDTQAGTEYDLTHVHAIPNYVTLIEQLSCQYTSKKLKCKNYWVSISQPDTAVVSHNHLDQSRCDFSAIIYICADDHAGNLNLEDYSVSLHVSAGDVVLFPASCYHSVTPNQSKRNRICVAFDLKYVA